MLFSVSFQIQSRKIKMPLVGISVKLWSSEYDPSNSEFLTSDSVVYVFQDRSQEDILYISSVVKHLTGDDSLDEIFNQNLPSVKGYYSSHNKIWL